MDGHSDSLCACLSPHGRAPVCPVPACLRMTGFWQRRGHVHALSSREMRRHERPSRASGRRDSPAGAAPKGRASSLLRQPLRASGSGWPIVDGRATTGRGWSVGQRPKFLLLASGSGVFSW
eukprot:scaffold210384_cov33-Tisochrysis_lutea.AAC.1